MQDTLSHVAFSQKILKIITFEDGKPVFHRDVLDSVYKEAEPTTWMLAADMTSYVVWMKDVPRQINLAVVWGTIGACPRHTFIFPIENP